MLDISSFKFNNYGIPMGSIGIVYVEDFCDEELDNEFNIINNYNIKLINSKTINEKTRYKDILLKNKVKCATNLLPSSSLYNKFFNNWKKDIFTKDEEDILNKNRISSNKPSFILNHYYKIDINNNIYNNEIQKIIDLICSGNNILFLVYTNKDSLIYLSKIFELLGIKVIFFKAINGEHNLLKLKDRYR